MARRSVVAPSRAAKAISSATRVGSTWPRSGRSEYWTGRTYSPGAIAPLPLDHHSGPRFDHARHGVHGRGQCHRFLVRGGKHLAIPVEEANPIDAPLSERQIVEEPGQVGVRPTAQGQGVLHRDLDRARHARGTCVLVGHPRARFLLHTDHTVDTAHEQERQHEEQDEAESKPHGSRGNDSVRVQGEQSRHETRTSTQRPPRRQLVAGRDNLSSANAPRGRFASSNDV